MTGGYADRQGEEKQRSCAKAVEILTRHKQDGGAGVSEPSQGCAFPGG